MDDAIDRLDALVDQLEGMDSTYAANHTKVALGLMRDESPSTIDVAALYLQWAISKRNIVENSYLRKCQCESGWVLGADGGEKPCPRCRPESNERWFRDFVDSENPPL